jgi:hypothetical protein
LTCQKQPAFSTILGNTQAEDIIEDMMRRQIEAAGAEDPVVTDRIAAIQIVGSTIVDQGLLVEDEVLVVMDRAAHAKTVGLTTIRSSTKASTVVSSILPL